MTLLDVLSILVLILPIFDWVSSAMLYRLHRQYPDISALEFATRTQITLSIAATISAALVFQWWSEGRFGSEAHVTVMLVASCLISIPGIMWIRQYFWHGFRDK